MEKLIICEGSTDYVLLQYYLRKAYSWEDSCPGNIKISGQRSRTLCKGSKKLTILSTGGCSRLMEGLELAVQKSRLGSPDHADSFDRIIILTDRDEDMTEQNFLNSIQTTLVNNHITYSESIRNNQWSACSLTDSYGNSYVFSILPMVIPFEEKGALETFLLDAVSNQDCYDASIITACRSFIAGVDSEKRYLHKRRLVTKAEFDVFFSVRTAAEQFEERRNILKSIPWENYTSIQDAFQQFVEL